MLRKIITLNHAYYVNWTPDDVCKLFKNKSITASALVQSNKLNTKKLIRELFLLACRASLNSTEVTNTKAVILSSYAKKIKEISNDYDDLFGRKTMIDANTLAKDEIAEDSTITSIDRLQARLFYLITQYSVHPCKHIAARIVEQLTVLCQHPNIGLLPAQHYIYSQSINYWRSRLISSAQPRTKAELH